MKYQVLYDTRILDDEYKKGDLLEFAEGTDKGFITRLEYIGAIKPLSKAEEAKTQKELEAKVKQDAKAKKEPKSKPNEINEDDEVND